MRRVLLALVALLPASPVVFPQDKGGTVEDVIKLMEARAASLKDVTFEVENVGADMVMPGGEMSVTVQAKPGTGTRIRAVARRTEGARGGMPDMLGLFGDLDIVYGRDALYIFQERPFTSGAPMISAALKVRYADPSFKWVDPYFLPLGMPVRLAMDDPTLYYQLDPRFHFGLENNLTYEGKRTEKGRAVHVLSSFLPASEDLKRCNSTEFVFTGSRKEIFIDAETGAVTRFVLQVSVVTSMMGQSSEETGTLTVDPSGSIKVTDTLSIPESTTWTFATNRAGRRVRDGNALHRRFQNVKVNTGVKAEEILSDAESKELCGEALTLKASEYDAPIRKNPKDAVAIYSQAIAQGTPSIMGMMGGGGSDVVDLTKAFDKLVELSPDSIRPKLNLFAACIKSNDGEREKGILQKIETGDWSGLPLVVAAVERLNEKGEHDRAVKLVDSIKAPTDSQRRRLGVERILAVLGKKDDVALAAAVAAEAARRPLTVDKVSLVMEFETRMGSLPKESFAAYTAAKAEQLLAAAAKADPRELFYPLAIAHLHEATFSAKTVAACTAILTTSPADESAVDYVLSILGREFGDAPSRDQIMVRVRAPGEDEEPVQEKRSGWTADVTPAFCAALDGVKGAIRNDPRIDLDLGRAFRESGHPEDAMKRFEASLKICSTFKKGDARATTAAAALFRLGMEKVSGSQEAWRDRCVEAVLTLSPDGASLPYWMVYDEAKNPILAQASQYISDKAWIKFFKLSQRAGERALGSHWTLSQKLNGTLANECAETCKTAVLAEAKESEPLKKYAKFARTYLNDAGSVEVLEKARDLSPKDVEALAMLAETAGRLGENDKAIKAYEQMLPLVATPVTIEDETWTRNSTILAIASQYEQRHDPTKVKATLAKIDLKSPDVDRATAMTVGRLYGSIDESDLGIAAYMRARELGARPHFALGRLHEKKQDFYEALRWYNRDITLGSSNEGFEGRPGPQVMQLDEDGEDEPDPESKEPQNGKDARERLLRKVGPDFLLKRLMEQKFDALTKDEDKSVRTAFEQLSSDAMDDRDSGAQTLEKIGAKATPLLHELVKTGDAEVTTRVKKLFLQWAEPK